MTAFSLDAISYRLTIIVLLFGQELSAYIQLEMTRISSQLFFWCGDWDVPPS